MDNNNINKSDNITNNINSIAKSNNNIEMDSDSNNQNTMFVKKRDGKEEEISFDKIVKRFRYLCKDLNDINIFQLAQTIITKIYNGIHTSEIDELAAETCASKMTLNPSYGLLASRIAISNHHKNTSPSFSEVIHLLKQNKDTNGESNSLVNDELYKMTMSHKNKINSVIDWEKDYNFDYFGFKTLERAYLLRINDKIVERPQHMIMRVCLSIHKDNLKEAIQSYKLMSEGYFTHATPTLFNMGSQREQAFSCFLLQMHDDSIDGIYKTISDCAKISKFAGGIGVAVHKIRAKNSTIRSTNGKTDGIVPMLKVMESTARYVNQSGKRKGSIAIYLEPWHADIEDFLMLRRNTGAETERARDLFYSMWIPDLFMKRVESDSEWTLMCPDECPGLHTSYGDEFENKYIEYEKAGKGRKTVSARKIWETILESQIETGTPYIGYKDAANKKSNQNNLGTIQSSNLCIEIIEYTAQDEHAVCCLLSVALPKFVEIKENKKSKTIKRTYNYKKLQEVTKMAVKNLNKLIDYNYYPTQESSNSNMRHRPIGIGVQGLADVFALLRIPFDSDEAVEISKNIAENMYFAAVESSMEIAKSRKKYVQEYRRLLKKYIKFEDSKNKVVEIKNKSGESKTKSDESKTKSDESKSKSDESKTKVEEGKNKSDENKNNDKSNNNDIEDLTKEEREQMDNLKKTYFIQDEEVDKLPMSLAGAYSSFSGSEAHNGKLQFDLWGIECSKDMKDDWDKLKENIKKHGLRNSLLMAMMPTASTSQILGNNECIEPYTNNIYTRQTLAGTFTIINKHLIKDLIEVKLWSQELKDKIILADGSVQNIEEIPDNIKKLYKTVWELKQKWLIDHAAARAPFICQTQSMNLFMKEPTFKKLNAMHFYSWKKGLKTGIYYLRSLAKSQSQKFSVDMSAKRERKTSTSINDGDNNNNNSNNGIEECVMCSA